MSRDTIQITSRSGFQSQLNELERMNAGIKPETDSIIEALTKAASVGVVGSAKIAPAYSDTVTATAEVLAAATAAVTATQASVTAVLADLRAILANLGRIDDAGAAEVLR